MDAPPTFLFTDIEGSTRRWETDRAAMAAALARHDALLRTAIEGRGGTVFKTMGDAFCAVFHSPLAALEAAQAAQLALAVEDWQAFGAQFAALRVRMAVHTGLAEARDDDWFGPPLNRVARLLAVAHGGQVLVSDAVEGLVVGHLSRELSLGDLGEHRLKDLARPGRIFQLRAPGLEAEFPPLRSLDSFAHNLPPQLTSFVGREDELARVKEVMGRVRLLTLTGLGGTGKTRLAVQAAADLLDHYPDGVWLVELAPLSDPALLPQSIATVFGLREESGRSLDATLMDHLRERRLLLLLDNCEHLAEACAALVGRLLRSAPGLAVLATSRAPLGVAGESVWPLPPLALPPGAEGDAPLPEDLLSHAAPRLFVERARAVRPDFQLTAENAAAVLAICRGLDGIALAIELAASRVRAMSPAQIAGRLEHRFQLLTGGSRSAMPQQQTLRAALDWSHDLLEPRDRVLLRRLSVFADGWTLEAAEAICSDADPGGADAIADWEVLDVFTRLVGQSLVAVNVDATRYRLLETVRAYGREKLEAAGELPQLAERHASAFLALAEEAEPGLLGAQAQVWLERLDADRANLRAALDWAAGRAVGADAALRLSGALWRYWYMRGTMTEGRRELERALTLPGGADGEPARAKALHGAGTLAGAQGDFGAARRCLEEALGLWQAQGNTEAARRTVNNLAVFVHEQGDYQAARPLFETCLAEARMAGDEAALATAYNNLAAVALELGDLDAAEEGFGASLAIERRLGNREGSAHALRELGATALERGDLVRARELVQEALPISSELGDPHAMAEAWRHLGAIDQRQGDLAAAREAYQQALAMEQDMANLRGTAITQTFLGLLALEAGEEADARSRLEAGLAVLEDIGHRRWLASNLSGLGLLALRRADLGAARRYLARGLALRRAMGSPLHLVASLEAVADLAWATGQAKEAQALIAAADAARNRLGAPRAAVRSGELVGSFGAATSTAATAAASGEALPLEAAADLASVLVGEGDGAT